MAARLREQIDVGGRVRRERLRDAGRSSCSRTARPTRSRAGCSSPTSRSTRVPATFTLRAIVPEPERHAAARHVRARHVNREASTNTRMLAPQSACRATRRAIATRAAWSSADGKVEPRTCQDRAASATVARRATACGGRPADRRGQPEGPARRCRCTRRERDPAATATPAPPAPPAGAAHWTASAMSRFFIDRPIFAWVIAIIIMLAGVARDHPAAGRAVPRHRAAARSRSAPPIPAPRPKTVEESVTQVIEQNLTGIDGLHLHRPRPATARAVERSQLTFASGTNPDIAQVQVQNKLQQAMPLLPQIVQLQGISVTKASSGFLMVIAFDLRRRPRMSAGDIGRLPRRATSSIR